MADIYIAFCSFTYIISFNLYNSPIIFILLKSLFFKMREMRYREISEFSQDHQLVKIKSGIQMQTI